tara:strand:+ start:52 stop:594 length:543 start_codon:yes stop_codon:yes gene_type:complete
MRFLSSSINDVVLLEPVIFEDDRGSFRRNFCQKEFKKNGLESTFLQGNISENPISGTLRGFHYQIKPYQESKTISCITGSIFDVVIDLRKDSSTFLKYSTFELNATNRNSIFIPSGCANAWLTLEPNTIIHYYMSEFYKPGFEAGIRYDDPFFNIAWPKSIKKISLKDQSYNNFSPENSL